MKADGLWQMILPNFGIGQEFLKNRHGPCPGCGGKDRFRFDDKQGTGSWYCGGGGNPSYGDGYGLLSHVHGWDNARAYKEVQRWIDAGSAAKPITAGPRPAPKASTQDYALRLWKESVAGVAFHPYAKSKGITWEAGAERHHSVSGRVVGKGSDCILIPIRDLKTEKLVAVQAINPEGKKQTFGPIKGHGFVCGNTLDKTLDWYVVEGWADAVSMVFHHHKGNAVAFASFGKTGMEALAQKIADVYQPNTVMILEDAA